MDNYNKRLLRLHKIIKKIINAFIMFNKLNMCCSRPVHIINSNVFVIMFVKRVYKGLSRF